MSFPHFQNCLPPVEIRSRNSKGPLHSGNISVVVILQREGSAFWLFAIVGWILCAPAKIRSHWEYQVVKITQFHQFGQLFRFTNKDLQMMLRVNLLLVSNCGQNNNSSNRTSGKKSLILRSMSQSQLKVKFSFLPGLIDEKKAPTAPKLQKLTDKTFLSDPGLIIVYPCHLLTDWLTHYLP